jgi:D-arginine dehydrogenase
VEHTFDFGVVGAGMAGVSAAYELARDSTVCVLEREDLLACHSTGRSAAISLQAYGNATVRALTCASRAFYLSPPEGFAPEPLSSRRPALYLAGPDRVHELRAHFDAVRPLVPTLLWLEGTALLEVVPCLALDCWRAGILEPDGLDLDVHGIHQGYVHGLKLRGGRVMTGAEVRHIGRRAGRWILQTPVGEVSARVLVNAAGAWADDVGRRAGARPIGLRPLRRTAILVDAGPESARWPYVGSIDEELYFKPDAGRLLVSPCDETPVEPHDPAPDPYDVAVAVDRLERATTIRVAHVAHRWAGLRSFVADRTPVAGRDPEIDELVWLAAQGGYGIQTAPALARACRALAVGEDLPRDLAALGVRPEALMPARCRAAA